MENNEEKEEIIIEEFLKRLRESKGWTIMMLHTI